MKVIVESRDHSQVGQRVLLMEPAANRWTQPVFYIDEAVQSMQYGLGLVVRGGHNPWVRFLCGAELLVDGGTLRVVPNDDYDVEARNQYEIERWLTQRLTGRSVNQPSTLPTARVDLAERIRRSSGWSALSHSKAAVSEAREIIDGLDVVER